MAAELLQPAAPTAEDHTNPVRHGRPAVTYLLKQQIKSFWPGLSMPKIEFDAVFSLSHELGRENRTLVGSVSQCYDLHSVGLHSVELTCSHCLCLASVWVARRPSPIEKKTYVCAKTGQDLLRKSVFLNIKVIC